MKKHLFTCFLASLCLYGSEIRAQNRVDESPITGADLLHRSMPHVSSGEGDTHRGGDVRPDTLSIGDQIPAGIEFSDVLQYDSDKLRLDDYRGRYVILEFWAPTCTASIASLPEMDAIQKKYGDRIAVLPITVFPADRIKETISGIERLDAVELPLVVDARKMRSYFPHSVIPHVVVLDPEGEVVAITGIEDVTTANLDELMDKGTSSFRTKSDTQISLPIGERLISGAPAVENKNLWFQSAMTGYIPELRGSLTQEFKEMTHIRIINMPLLYHYSLAYSGKDKVDYFTRNRIDTLGFDIEEIWSHKMGRDYEDWMAEGTHVFGYELIVPAHTDPYRMMREDLARFFPHIQVSVEKKKRMVYALVQQEGKNCPPASSTTRTYSSKSGLDMTDYPLQGFVYHLNAVFHRNSPYPIINLTGIDYPIDLRLDANLADVESLIEALQDNGLDLILREEVINVLVLKKISEPNLLAP